MTDLPHFQTRNRAKDKILFLYAAPDSGHKACADAIRKALQLERPHLETVGLDAIHSLFPVLGPIVAKTYLELLHQAPQVWNFLYDNPEIESLTRELRQLFSFLNASKLDEAISAHRPRAIVCTHAIPCAMAAEQKRRGKLKTPLVAVITDFAAHSYWTHPEVDLYIAPNLTAKKTLTDRGIRRERIAVCGIPCDPEFARRADKSQARAKLGIRLDSPVVLLMGGFRGMGPMLEIVDSIQAAGQAQILAVAGTSRALEKELKKRISPKAGRVFGFTRSISTLMDAADLIVTKPGGLTSSEALAKSLPIAIVQPLPGQEERNARHLLGKGAAVRLNHPSQAGKTIFALLGDPERLKKISERARKIATPQAAQDAAREVLHLILGPAVGAARRFPELAGSLG